MDKVDSLTRSRTMAAVRSKGNRSTEWRLRPYLIRAGIRGWKVQAFDLSGKPDFVFPKERIAVFVDGCFWHGCPKCCRMPQSNTKYWREKIAKNKNRDKQNIKNLSALGWKIIRLWEHDLKNNPIAFIRNLCTLIDKSR